MASPTDSKLDILARPGENDKVIEKKVLLAHLARQEAARVGIAPDTGDVRELAEHYCRELGLRERESILAWLAEAGLSQDEFHTVIADFAAVLAVEAHHREQLVKRVELHRRVVAARSQQLAGNTSPR